MSITVNIESVDRSDHIDWSSLEIEQNLTDELDVASVLYRQGYRSYIPEVTEEIEINDGATKIFGGQIISISESVMSGAGGLVYEVKCVDHTYAFDAQLVSTTYENETVADIIDDIVTNFTDGSFTTLNVVSTFVIKKIVFNQVEPSRCVKRLAEILQYHWYIDPDKDIHFFPILTESAPFDLTDSSGNYVYRSLIRRLEGSQLANRVIVRGGQYDEASTFTDDITVSGDASLSFTLPYQMANLAISVDTGGGFVSKTVGVEFIDDFTSVDVLYNFQNSSIRFETVLSGGDVIRFSGNRKIRVLAIAQDAASIAQFGTRSKLIRDTTIEDLNIARKRAQAEIVRFKDELTEINFTTRTIGLNVGMSMNLNSAERGVNADYIIRKLTFATIDPNTFEYRVNLVNTRSQTFLQLLQSLFEPDPLIADETEVSEVIETDIVTVAITETIDTVTPQEDDFTVTISEDIQDDPLGANVEPIWVLADHIPNPWPTDTKRNGLLNVSMKLT